MIQLQLAVLVVDMNKDFVDGKFGNEHCAAIIPTLKALLTRAREANIPVIYLQNEYRKGDPDISLVNSHAMSGDVDWAIVDQLKPESGDIVIKKLFYSGFFDSDLDDKLKKLKIDTLIFTGISTDICIQHNVADAFFRGFKCYVVNDGTASIDESTHEQALDHMSENYSAEVVDSEKVKKLFLNRD